LVAGDESQLGPLILLEFAKILKGVNKDEIETAKLLKLLDKLRDAARSCVESWKAYPECGIYYNDCRELTKVLEVVMSLNQALNYTSICVLKLESIVKKGKGKNPNISTKLSPVKDLLHSTLTLLKTELLSKIIALSKLTPTSITQLLFTPSKDTGVELSGNMQAGVAENAIESWKATYATYLQFVESRLKL
jgi:hypothetical protein